MRIKLLTTAMVAGLTHAIPSGTVIESKDEGVIAEYKALVNVGYAAETNEAVTDPAGYAYNVGGNTPPISGEVAADAVDARKAADEAHLAALEGTVGEVATYAATLDKAGAKRLGALEAGSKGRQRAGVASAVESHIAGLE